MPKAAKAKRSERSTALEKVFSPHSSHMPAGALRINFPALPAGWGFKVPIVRAIEVMAAVGNVPIRYEDFAVMFFKLYPEEKKRPTANIKDMINQISWKLEGVG